MELTFDQKLELMKLAVQATVSAPNYIPAEADKYVPNAYHAFVKAIASDTPSSSE